MQGEAIDFPPRVRAALAVEGFALRSARAVAAGWDCRVYLVNEALAVRVPRRLLGGQAPWSRGAGPRPRAGRGRPARAGGTPVRGGWGAGVHALPVPPGRRTDRLRRGGDRCLAGDGRVPEPAARDRAGPHRGPASNPCPGRARACHKAGVRRSGRAGGGRVWPRSGDGPREGERPGRARSCTLSWRSFRPSSPTTATLPSSRCWCTATSCPSTCYWRRIRDAFRR